MIKTQSLEKKIEIDFKDKNLLKKALIHRSYLNEHPKEKLPSNERLEFLGDAILEFIISEKIYTLFPELNEGILTTFRSQIVKTDSLAQAANQFQLGEYLLLSKGEEEGGGRKNKSLLANAFEALIGAIYLDQGLEKTKKFIDSFLGKRITKISHQKSLKDYKSLFQEKAQEKEKLTPVYRLIRGFGPDHDKIFIVGVFLGKKKITQGKGKSKQEAEQQAAKKGLKIYA